MYLSAQPQKICYYIISSREHILIIEYKRRLDNMKNKNIVTLTKIVSDFEDYVLQLEDM